jgi:uncharacterized repeat protein (TIGR01451 family)
MNRLSLAVASSLAVLLLASPAFGSFHLMKVEQAVGGVGGDTSQQAIQLRMRAPGQNLVGTSQARLIARDAAGMNPVVLIVFGSDAAYATQGSRILVVSSAFAAAQPGIPGDFTMTNLIPPSYLAAGRLTFEDSGGIVYWSLAWGGPGYTGPNTGSVFNDPDGNFGPQFGSALPSSTNRALLFTASDPTGAAASTNNAADYSVTGGAAVFTNNAGASGLVNAPTADLSITKTDGQATASPGQPITYTIVASNAGPDPVTGATVTDTVPAALTGATWTCLGAGGGMCAPNGAGSINDNTVNLPVNATVTYTLMGTVSLNPASLSNTAIVSLPGGMTDPNPANNTATDTDTLICASETVVIPDGRLTDSVIGAGSTTWFLANLSLGRSYSVELKNTTGTGTPPGTLTVFRGDDGCLGVSTLTVRDTTVIEPGEATGRPGSASPPAGATRPSGRSW